MLNIHQITKIPTTKKTSTPIHKKKTKKTFLTYHTHIHIPLFQYKLQYILQLCINKVSCPRLRDNFLLQYYISMCPIRSDLHASAPENEILRQIVSMPIDKNVRTPHYFFLFSILKLWRYTENVKRTQQQHTHIHIIKQISIPTHKTKNIHMIYKLLNFVISCLYACFLYCVPLSGPLLKINMNDT